MREQQAPAMEVSAHDAYQAAEQRALRTTQALILAEAQNLTLSNRVRELEALTKEQRAELQHYFEQEENRAREEVTHDAAQTDEGADARAEARATHPFSD